MVVAVQPPLPLCFDEGIRSLSAPAELRIRFAAVRMRDVDLKVGGRDGKSAGANIRPVGESRNFLLDVCGEAEPPELSA